MAMRNYGAMGATKLLTSIDQLQRESGPAYDRVMGQRDWPANSVSKNLELALQAASDKGLAQAAGIAPAPAPVAVNTLCRGCAGTGVDYSVPTRLVQIAEGPWTFGPRTHVALGVDAGSPALNVLGEPLARLLARIEKGTGAVKHAVHDVPFPLTKADACTWCHGTGKPQPVEVS